MFDRLLVKILQSHGAEEHRQHADLILRPHLGVECAAIRENPVTPSDIDHSHPHPSRIGSVSLLDQEWELGLQRNGHVLLQQSSDSPSNRRCYVTMIRRHTYGCLAELVLFGAES
jgi:hypothetical protein